MEHLVLGGTGTVGSGVVRGLLARGEGVRVLTRTAARAATLPAGAAAHIGDLELPATVSRAFVGAETLYLLGPVATTELQQGLTALAEARRHGVRRIVYHSVLHADRGPHIPHFAAKLAIEQALRASGIPTTVLRPGSFYQNNRLYRDAMLQHGVYPQPFGRMGVCCVDARDVSEAAVNALTDARHEGRTYAVAAPEPLTGEACAALWSTALGRPVNYGGDDLEMFAAQLSAMLPPWMVYDLAMMYALFQAEGLRATEAQVAETRELLGHAPRDLTSFAREAAVEWGVPSAAAEPPVRA